MLNVATEFAYVPSPTWLVGDVMGYISDRMKEQNALTGEDAPLALPPVTTPSPTVRDTKTAWSENDLRNLLPLLYPQNEVALAVLDMTAATPGELVSFPNACASTMNKKAPAQGKAGIGALAKVCKKLGKVTWPVSVEWNALGDYVMYYRMTDDIAAKWKKVRSERPLA